jgi:RNA polymerase sigma factor for flagellar operon FliA
MSNSKVAQYENVSEDNLSEARVLQHLGLVKRIAVHLRARVPRYMEFDELVQAGMIGLIKAARSFDPTKGVMFESFASIRIKGAILDEVRHMSYLPRSAVAINRQHEESGAELASILGRAPTKTELAQFMGKDTEDLQLERSDAMRFETTSIETVSEFVKNIPAEDQSRPDVLLENSQTLGNLKLAIEELAERDQLVVSLYYVEEMNLREIGDVIGVTEGRVSQILATVAKQLRKSLMAA